MDGNNSLKRMKLVQGRTAADTRTLEDAEYFLPREYVDRFANETRGKKLKGPRIPAQTGHDEGDGSEWSDESADEASDVEGDPTDGARANPNDVDTTSASALKRRAIEACVKNWKAAAADEKKSMWEIFDETGIFAAACRHGLLLLLVDMVRSGEL